MQVPGYQGGRRGLCGGPLPHRVKIDADMPGSVICAILGRVGGRHCRQHTGPPDGVSASAATVFPVLFLQAPASAVPVLLDAGLAGADAEAVQLGSFSQAALELGEAGERGEPDNVVPQPDRLLVSREPADDRPEKRGPPGPCR